MALLEIANLSLRFGGVSALQEVSFAVAPGELAAIIGPNGAGKTSLLNCISGVYRPQQGSIRFDGRDITRLAPAARTRLGVARTFQNIALFRGMTVLDNLLIGRHVHQKTGILAGGIPGRAGRVSDTFPKLLARNAERLGDRPALREKDLGIWRETSWRRYHERVRDFSLGLVSLGLQRGGKVAIVGDNRPEWIVAELAAQAAGAASVGIYQDANLTEVAHVIDHCDARFVVAEDQEQLDKILGMIDQLGKVKHVVFADPRGLRTYSDPRLVSFAAVE